MSDVPEWQVLVVARTEVLSEATVKASRGLHLTRRHARLRHRFLDYFCGAGGLPVTSFSISNPDFAPKFGFNAVSLGLCNCVSRTKSAQIYPVAPRRLVHSQ
jgi:hypothetical protein